MGKVLHVWGHRIYGKISALSPQFSCEPKTAPKDRLTKTFLRVLKISLPSKPK